MLYGSNLGTTEEFARAIAQSADLNGFEATLADLDDYVGRLPTDGAVVVASASYNGAPPDNAAAFVKWLAEAAPGDASPWPMGVPRLRLHREAPSRSALKLEEAFLVLLGAGERLPEREDMLVATGGPHHQRGGRLASERRAGPALPALQGHIEAPLAVALPHRDDLAAALEAFAEHGYHGTTVREIASRAGLSVPGLYHHYPSKQSLLQGLSELTMSELLDRSVAGIASSASDTASCASSAQGCQASKSRGSRAISPARASSMRLPCSIVRTPLETARSMASAP